ncbi:MAG: multidrug RND transporter [Actinobacteria bacterium]|nr:MMPL family transporter [Candidatus Planktophila sp.]PHX66944.1 MAG: multidrug RND transporter [Actinomycetota bacterium]
MFERLGRFIVRNSRLTLTLFLLGTIAAGAIGFQAFGRLDSGGYSDKGSESYKATDYIINKFKVQEPVVTLVVDSTSSVDDPVVSAKGIALEREVRAIKGVTKTYSYWSTGGAPSMKSRDGKASFILVYADFKADDWDGFSALGAQIQENFDGEYQGLQVYAGGAGVITHAINKRIEKDLVLAESIAIPLTFLLLMFVFGALVASVMPLFVGITAILGSFFLIFLLSHFTNVSVFALNLITGLGLGLGIDYALLMVNRFREELHHGKSVEESVVTTVATAGKTVFYSGLTVLVTMASLLFFPLDFLKSFGYAGIAVISLAIIGAVLALPALLAILGERVDKGVVRRGAITPKEDGRWARTARAVMHRPLPVVIASLLVLGIMAAPVLNIAFAQVDSRVLPASDRAALSSSVIETRFDGLVGSPIEVVIPKGVGREDQITSFLSKVRDIDGIVRVGSLEVFGEDIRVQVISSLASRSTASERVIHEIRALERPEGTLIGGSAADFTDSQDGIADKLPLALGWIALTVLILIFIFTGSIILPIKAIILNGLSLCATLGAITWIFINGHLKWLVGDFTVTGTLDTGTVILVAVVVFGLSMDYELFLLSRIREEHLAGKSNVESVAVGLQRSARIITAAAVLLAVVFATFVTSGVTSIKMLGFGVALAVLLDATIVRALLVPALMRLFGESNWWAPKALRRFTLKH